jgi:hypothetical protein
MSNEHSEQPVAINSRALKIVALVVIAVVVVAVVYGALTFPRTIVNFPVAFSAGADRVQQQFEIPLLQDKAQVEVSITSGSSLWRATITDANGVELWNHSTAQGEETTYYSAWITLPIGSYNFTFTIPRPESLNAEVRITSKGGFW